MIHKRFTFLVVVRALLLLANMIVLSRIILDTSLLFNQITFGIIFILQVIELIRFVNKTNRELARFFTSIRHNDFSINFYQSQRGASFHLLDSSMMEILDAYKQVKIEKEVQYQFLQRLVRQLPVGIISLENNEIVMINPMAERILAVEGLKTWSQLQLRAPSVAEEILLLGEHGRKLINTKSHHGTSWLSLEVSTTLTLDKPHTLITLQDINTEIEQKEIEAWHKLIRILTHEIMNSVTPIASLTETMQSMLTDNQGAVKSLSSLSPETLEDIRFSLQTIHKRSDGLLHFVENYRKLTRIPKPSFETVHIPSFLNNVIKLMEQEFQQQHVQLSLQVPDESLSASFDPSLVEQVIINLFTNSLYALQTIENKTITVMAYRQDRRVVMEVSDNGKGITEKELKEIFIPFFSTKEEGSGIGLSLSKQIMTLHEGSIRVVSVPEVKTTFYLLFKG